MVMETQKKVLIIEDNYYDQQLLTIFIKRCCEWKILYASDGREGIEKISLESPDLVFLDISLPTMDGFKLLLTIRTTFPDLKTKIIPISIYSDALTITKFFTLGIDQYIVKPLHEFDNISKIEQIFSELNRESGHEENN
jgi:YesN/AraC family two-component response regulator